MVVACRAARKGVRSRAKESPKESARQRATPWPMSDVPKILTGPAIVLHIMVAKGSVSFRLARDPRTPLLFRQTYLEGDGHPVKLLRFSFASGEEDVSSSAMLVPYLPWRVNFYIRVLNAPGPVLLGADAREDLGLVVDHVDGTMFLSHLKLEDMVERLPSRHLALSTDL